MHSIFFECVIKISAIIQGKEESQWRGYVTGAGFAEPQRQEQSFRVRRLPENAQGKTKTATTGSTNGSGSDSIRVILKGGETNGTQRFLTAHSLAHGRYSRQVFAGSTAQR